MTLSPPLTVDFNPMLAVSVFGHLFFLSVFMFLPQSKVILEKIEPVFMVDLIELPGGLMDAIEFPVVPEPTPVERAQPAPKPVVTKPRQMAPPKAEFSPPPEAVASKPKISPPPKVSPSQSILQELDQVAKLETAKSRPAAADPRQALLEETLRELDALKKMPLQSVDSQKPAPLEIDNSLEGFENLRMKQQHTPVAPVAPQNGLRRELTPDEKQFQELSERKVELAVHKKNPAKTTASLLKELAALEKIATPSAIPKIKTPSVSMNPTPAPAIAVSLQKKLAALQKKKFTFNIQTQILPSTGSATAYSSEIRKVKTMPGGQPVKASKVTTRQEHAKTLPGIAGTGKSGASAISQYVGLVHIRILENWQDPLGGEGQAQVSFYIFPEGNISRPALIKSSGSAKLDTLALLAVKKSEPFPPFSKGLRRPNLPITVNFDYVAE